MIKIEPYTNKQYLEDYYREKEQKKEKERKYHEYKLSVVEYTCRYMGDVYEDNLMNKHSYPYICRLDKKGRNCQGKCSQYEKITPLADLLAPIFIPSTFAFIFYLLYLLNNFASTQ